MKFYVTVALFGMVALLSAMVIWPSYTGLYPTTHQPLQSRMSKQKQTLFTRTANSTRINEIYRPQAAVYYDKKKSASATTTLICPDRNHVETAIVDRFKRKIPKDLYNLAPDMGGYKHVNQLKATADYCHACNKVFDSVPSQFMEELRNPCWKSSEQSTLSCLPSFFLAGMPKAGSSDLWTKITRHPDIIRTVKEPHWWTRYRISQKASSLTAYCKFLSHAITANVQRITESIVGDGSASTFWDNMKWAKYFPDSCQDVGPPYTISDVIHTVLPKSKILVIFRDPSERLYSGYVYFGNPAGLGRTPARFHDDVLKTIAAFNNCLTQASQRACIYSAAHQEPNLQLGLYSVFVRDWLKVFPRDQLMFLRLEDWHTNCPEILPNIFKFLELESQSQQDILTMCATERSNPTHTYKGPMLNETRRILDEFYATTRHELAEILNDKSFLWE